MGIFLSGCGLLRQAARLKRLPDHAALSLWLAHGLQSAEKELEPLSIAPPIGDLIVHVWTPTGSVGDAVPQPLVDRYIAAVDAKGVVSTGHAALECPPDTYVSHYPAVEIDRSGDDFTRVLRATVDNDVAGKFQPSYAIEAAGWCNSTVQVRFERYDHGRLLAFWQRYRQDATYNLTNRNCSSSVAHCLEAALEGALASSGAGPRDFMRAMLNPELWVAAQLRKRAEAMAWTPGLVLDYARALNAAIQPSPWGWYTLIAASRRFWRYGVMVVKGQPIRNVDSMDDGSDGGPRDDPASR
jgi:hypothetical protein